MKYAVSIALLIAAGAGLAGCGYRGDLQRPPPMWGEERQQHEEQERAAEEAEQPAPAQPN